LLDSLLARADVLLESLSAADAARLALDQEHLQQVNPALIALSITGFGRTGPRSGLLAPDLVTVATGGILNMSGDPRLPPCSPPEQQACYLTGAYAASAVVACLYGREADGLGDWV
jgi:crotonobetainyl-CoA:carnitine CoA-transferase CaiB-like acyl-CoA transferase